MLKDILKELYEDQKLSITKIAPIFNVSSSTIVRWMIKYEIPRRSQSEAHKGQPSWNKGKHMKEKSKRKLAKNLRLGFANGRVPWNKGKPGFKDSVVTIEKKRNSSIEKWKNVEYREKVVRGISKALTGRIITEEHRRKISKTLKGRHSSPKTEFKKGLVVSQEHKQQLSLLQKERWKNPSYKEKFGRIMKKQNMNLDFQQKRLKALATKPTTPETSLMNLITRFNLPFKYVGDGSVIIGNLNPDFINENERKIIEVFGRVFHDPATSFFPISVKRQVAGRTEYFNQYGFDTLVVWDNELEDETKVVEKIRNFMGGGKIVSV